MQDLMKVALGEAAADLAIVNGDIVNVYTGEVLTGDTVLIKGDRIAYVGKNADKSIGSSTKVIDAAGKTLIPGLIDGHGHIDYPYSMGELVKYAMKGATTTIVSEVDMIVFPLGYQGVIQFLKSAEEQPIKILVTIAPMVSMSPAVREHGITVNELRRLLRRREVIRLGEPYWAPVIAGTPQILDLMAETINAGKRVDGHGSAAKGNKLQAYAASGVSTDHESTTAEEVKERLRLGFYVLIREGEIRRELDEISKIKDENIDLTRLGLASDAIGPWQLVEDGYMDFIVQKAINLGFDPITAIKMGTINTAQHFGLDNLIGGIAPGRYADIVIIPNLRRIQAEYVITNGQLVVGDGQLLVEPKKHAYPKSMERSVRLTRDFTAEDFAIPVDTAKKQVKVRVITQATELVTREAIVDVPVSDGRLSIDVDADLLKVAAIERTYVPGKTFVGFIRGFKMKRGAIAASISWDTSVILVVGASEVDMALAVNRIRQLKGGMVVCAGDKIVTETALPIGGLISLEPMETLAHQLSDFQQAAADLGCPFPDVRTTLVTLPTAAIPFLRICEEGLFNVAQWSFVDLVVG
jgi:adenine deaminase